MIQTIVGICIYCPEIIIFCSNADLCFGVFALLKPVDLIIDVIVDIDAIFYQQSQLQAEFIIVNDAVCRDCQLEICNFDTTQTTGSHRMHPDGRDHFAALRNICSGIPDFSQVAMGDFSKFFLISILSNRVNQSLNLSGVSLNREICRRNYWSCLAF